MSIDMGGSSHKLDKQLSAEQQLYKCSGKASVQILLIALCALAFLPQLHALQYSDHSHRGYNHHQGKSLARQIHNHEVWHPHNHLKSILVNNDAPVYREPSREVKVEKNIDGPQHHHIPRVVKVVEVIETKLPLPAGIQLLRHKREANQDGGLALREERAAKRRRKERRDDEEEPKSDDEESEKTEDDNDEQQQSIQHKSSKRQKKKRLNSKKARAKSEDQADLAEQGPDEHGQEKATSLQKSIDVDRDQSAVEERKRKKEDLRSHREEESEHPPTRKKKKKQHKSPESGKRAAEGEVDEQIELETKAPAHEPEEDQNKQEVVKSLNRDDIGADNMDNDKPSLRRLKAKRRRGKIASKRPLKEDKYGVQLEQESPPDLEEEEQKENNDGEEIEMERGLRKKSRQRPRAPRRKMSQLDFDVQQSELRKRTSSSRRRYPGYSKRLAALSKRKRNRSYRGFSNAAMVAAGASMSDIVPGVPSILTSLPRYNTTIAQDNAAIKELDRSIQDIDEEIERLEKMKVSRRRRREAVNALEQATQAVANLTGVRLNATTLTSTVEANSTHQALSQINGNGTASVPQEAQAAKGPSALNKRSAAAEGGAGEDTSKTGGVMKDSHKKLWERKRRQELEEQQWEKREREEERRLEEQRKRIEETWKKHLDEEKKRRRQLMEERERRERERMERERREEEEMRRQEALSRLKARKKELTERRKKEKESLERRIREEKERREREERERRLEEERRRQEEERRIREAQEAARRAKEREERLRRERERVFQERKRIAEKRRRERARRLMEERRTLDRLHAQLKEKLLAEKLKLHEREVRYKQLEKKHIAESIQAPETLSIEKEIAGLEKSIGIAEKNMASMMASADEFDVESGGNGRYGDIPDTDQGSSKARRRKYSSALASRVSRNKLSIADPVVSLDTTASVKSLDPLPPLPPLPPLDMNDGLLETTSTTIAATAEATTSPTITKRVRSPPKDPLDFIVDQHIKAAEAHLKSQTVDPLADVFKAIAPPQQPARPAGYPQIPGMAPGMAPVPQAPPAPPAGMMHAHAPVMQPQYMVPHPAGMQMGRPGMPANMAGRPMYPPPHGIPRKRETLVHSEPYQGPLMVFG